MSLDISTKISESLTSLGGQASSSLVFECLPHMTTNRLNQPGADVLSTPNLILHMEICAAQVVEELIPRNAGAVSVGHIVNIAHKGPIKIGEKVVVESKYKSHRGNKIDFEVVARRMADGKVIGIGEHQRAIIKV